MVVERFSFTVEPTMHEDVEGTIPRRAVLTLVFVWPEGFVPFEDAYVVVERHDTNRGGTVDYPA